MEMESKIEVTGVGEEVMGSYCFIVTVPVAEMKIYWNWRVVINAWHCDVIELLSGTLRNS
jgi:hypothetical protein